MAEFHAIRTARLTDRQVIDLICALHAEHGELSGSIQLGSGIGLNLSSLERTETPLSEIDSDRHAIREVNCSLSQISVQYYRGICRDLQKPSVDRQASPHFDEVLLRADKGASVHEWVTCIDTIETVLPKTYPSQEMAQGLDAIDVLRSEIALLSAQYRNMLDGLAKERSVFRTEAENDRRTARKEYTAERDRLKEEVDDQRRQFEEFKQREEGRLRTKQEELDQREQKLDDRQHVHARRDLRAKISEDFKKRLSRPVATKATIVMRLLVLISMVVAAGGVGLMSLTGFGDLATTASGEAVQSWLSVVGAFGRVVLTVVAIGFVAYAIKWLRSVYLDDVRTERRYEKYGHDIDRASFVIETIMEAGERGNMQVPDAWVEGVSRNLFSDYDEGESDSNANSALSSLLETISGVKFGPDGSKVSVDRRGAKKLAKKLSGG